MMRTREHSLQQPWEAVSPRGPGDKARGGAEETFPDLFSLGLSFLPGFPLSEPSEKQVGWEPRDASQGSAPQSPENTGAGGRGRGMELRSEDPAHLCVVFIVLITPSEIVLFLWLAHGLLAFFSTTMSAPQGQGPFRLATTALLMLSEVVGTG